MCVCVRVGVWVSEWGLLQLGRHYSTNLRLKPGSVANLQHLLYTHRRSIPKAYHWELIKYAIFQFVSLYFTSGKKKVRTHEKIELFFSTWLTPSSFEALAATIAGSREGGVPVIGAYRITSCAVRCTWDLILQLLVYAFNPGVEPEALGSRWSIITSCRCEDKVADILCWNVFNLLKGGV